MTLTFSLGREEFEKLQSPKDFDALINNFRSEAARSKETKHAWNLTKVEGDKETSDLIKTIRQEALPLNQFGAFLIENGRKVCMYLTQKDSPDDAVVEIDGEKHAIQIVSTIEPNDFLRDQACAEQGWVPLSGPIRQAKDGSVIFEFGPAKVTIQIDALKDLILDRIRSKCARDCSDGEWLLVPSSLVAIWDEEDLSRLLEGLRKGLQDLKIPFAKIYLLNNSETETLPKCCIEIFSREI